MCEKGGTSVNPALLIKNPPFLLRRETLNVCSEFFGHHLFWGSSDWSGSCGCGVWGHGFPFLLRAILTEVSGLAAPETQFFFHQFGPFFICQSFVDSGDDVYIHCVVILFSLKVPLGFPLFLFWHIPSDDSLHFMIVIVNLEGFFVPLRQSFWYIISIQDLFKERNLNGLLKVVEGGGRVLGNPKVSEEDFELCNMVFDGGVSLSHLNSFIEGIPFLVIRFKAISQFFQKVCPFSKIGFSSRHYGSF